jgi:hypothetical protein
MLQRTLLLAQRAADEAVSDAQAQARQLVEESEARAQAMVSEAESTARRIAESERRRLEDEIGELSRRRDVLAANADALEQYVAGYRERVRAAIEADLDSISRDRIDAPSPRPELQDVELPPARPDRPEPSEERVGVARAAEPDRRDTEWPPPANSGPAAPAAAGAYAAASSPAPSALRVDDPPVAPSTWLSDVDFSAPSPEADPGPAPWERATAEHQPFAAEAPLAAAPATDAPAPTEAAAPGAVPEPADDLDDDAFFASLREAVRDDAPLGPRDEPDTFFEEPHEERRSPFRRRR